MKKLVAVLLTVVLLLGCGVTAVSAESSKILPDLQKAMTEKAPDDEIGVYISYNLPVVTVADMPSWPDIDAARREYFAYSDQKQAEIQSEIFEGIDVRIGFQGVHNMVLAHVKVSDIGKIASYDIVRDIDYYDETNDEPAIETEPTIEEKIVDPAPDVEAKLSAALIEKLSDPDTNQVDVCIFLKNAIHSDAEIEQIISERYTWTTQQEHLMCWRKVVSEIIGAYVQQFIDDNADLLDEVLWHSNAVEMIEATVSKENVYRLAELNTVSNMDLYVEAIPEPDIKPEPTIEEKIVDAANELYHPSSPFPAEDIMMEFSYQFKDSSAYAVRFIVKDVEYISIELVEHIGDWLLYSGYYPEPYIFADQKLYTFKEAYEGGILSEAQMEELFEATRAQHSEFCLTRYIKGDADGDGEVSVIDATVIQRHEANIATAAFYKPLADVDGDDEVTVIDATLIQRKEAGLCEPIGTNP